jgi:hypothetical protein
MEPADSLARVTLDRWQERLSEDFFAYWGVSLSGCPYLRAQIRKASGP